MGNGQRPPPDMERWLSGLWREQGAGAAPGAAQTRPSNVPLAQWISEQFKRPEPPPPVGPVPQLSEVSGFDVHSQQRNNPSGVGVVPRDDPRRMLPPMAPPPAPPAPPAARSQIPEYEIHSGLPPSVANVPQGNATVPVQTVAPQQQPQVATRGPAPLQAPDLFSHGGYMLPDFDEYANQVETARMRGDMTDSEAEKRMAQWEKLATSTPGIQQRMMDSQLAGAQEQAQVRAQGILMGVSAQEQAAEAQEEARRQHEHETAAALQRREDWNTDMAHAMVQMNRAQEELDNTTVDPDRFFKTRGPASRFFAAIAQAMGAFGAGLTGGPNHAAQIIRDAINNDIAAQKADMSNKRAALSHRGNILRFAHERVHDIDQAEVVAKESIYKQLALQVDGIAARQGSDMARNSLNELGAKLRSYGEQVGLRKEALARGYADGEAAMKFQRAAAAQRAGADEEDFIRDMVEGDGAFLPDEYTDQVLQGVGLLAPGVESTIRKVKSRYAETRGMIERLRDIDTILERDGVAALAPASESRRQIGMLWMQVKMPDRARIFGGTLTEHESADYDRSMGADPNKPMDHAYYNMRQSIQELAARKTRDLQLGIESHGVHYGQVTPSTNLKHPKGPQVGWRFKPRELGGKTTTVWNPRGPVWPPPFEETKAAPSPKAE